MQFFGFSLCLPRFQQFSFIKFHDVPEIQQYFQCSRTIVCVRLNLERKILKFFF